MRNSNINVYTLVLLVFSIFHVYGALEDDGNSDYESYSDDDESPAEQIANIHPNSTIIPYFEEDSKIVIPTSDNKIVLDCPVNNFDAKQHLVLWYKEETPITIGMETLSNAYKIDKGYNLQVTNITNQTAGNYYCKILPSNVRQHSKLILSEGSDYSTTLPPELLSIPDINNISNNHKPVTGIIVVLLGIKGLHELIYPLRLLK